jgi:hypothetical protein
LLNRSSRSRRRSVDWRGSRPTARRRLNSSPLGQGGSARDLWVVGKFSALLKIRAGTNKKPRAGRS